MRSKEEIRKYHQKYFRLHKAKYYKRGEKYRQLHREEYNKYQREYKKGPGLEYNIKYRKEYLERYPGYASEKSKEFREKNPKYYLKYIATHRKEAYARSKVSQAVREGKLRSRSCEICLGLNSEAHHQDYDKPLEITWLCRSCRVLLHQKLNYKSKIK
jgi:hypothetical protein